MARERLLLTLLPELRAYALSICRKGDEVDDLVQDAIERALRANTRPRDIARLRPWMFRVIRNLRNDELRKIRVRREYFAREERLSDVSYAGRDNESDMQMRMLFQQMPPDMREILFLIDIMELKYREVAEILDVPTGTVMSRISRARKALRDLVEGSQRQDSTG
ncbi:RNA polymerase sigma factor [uncultured Paracoccus sp.]|uniref:RNA polymerase sigma factor n=1 Tax=uncultured Paracoccus sp. TaxID=189685 RepID=UPI0026298846|nr:RNA polymerase sigma factor [uncultured Paracoccus sp.]